MQIFKFGGASVKDAAGVKNVWSILEKFGSKNKVVVVSAMGKMTNALERIVNSYVIQKEDLSTNIEYFQNFHLQICDQLFIERSETHQKINCFVEDLRYFLKQNTSKNYDYIYDQVVPFGELISTTIISDYLRNGKIENEWIDARDLIRTDDTFREAKVDWEITESNIRSKLKKDKLYITQGFIASAGQNTSITLGREGSDYTAGIIAYCLDAEQVCIWKNVDGVMNGDPSEFENPILLEHISYQEAIEFAFFGASVIHPKTLQPLQRKGIPLYVKSFMCPEKKGTRVFDGLETIPQVPCFIVKKDLWLLSLSTTDFSFFVEENMSEVFQLFHQHQVKVHLIQNSAISFSVCIDNKYQTVPKLIEKLQGEFKVHYNQGVSLYTIRHFDQSAIDRIRYHKKVLLEQRTRETIQMITQG